MICPWLSSLYKAEAIPICLWLLKQLMALAFSFALLKAGSNIAARIAMIAMTTSSSISVNARARQGSAAASGSGKGNSEPVPGGGGASALIGLSLQRQPIVPCRQDRLHAGGFDTALRRDQRRIVGPRRKAVSK